MSVRSEIRLKIQFSQRFVRNHFHSLIPAQSASGNPEHRLFRSLSRGCKAFRSRCCRRKPCFLPVPAVSAAAIFPRVYGCMNQGINDKIFMASDSFRRQLAQSDVVAAEIVNNMGGVQLVALSCGHLKIW